MSKLERKAHFHVHINYKASQGILHSAAQCDLISYDHIRAAITERLAYKRTHYPPPIRCLVPNWIYICCFGDLGARTSDPAWYEDREAPGENTHYVIY